MLTQAEEENVEYSSVKKENAAPKISVVMASYNGERFIEAQLETIWNQTIRPDEIIISDDASTDRTLQIIKDFTARTGAPVRVISDGEKKGYIRNFLTALKEAGGDIIFLSDQDDLWKRNRISRAVELMEQYPDMLALNCGYELVDENGAVLRSGIMRVRKRRPGKNGTPEVKRKNRISEAAGSSEAAIEAVKIPCETFLRHPKYPGMAMAFRREIAEMTLLREDFVSAHDWQLNIVAALRDGLYRTDEVLVSYRQHGGNTVGTIRTGKQKEAMKKRLTLLHVMRDELDTLTVRHELAPMTQHKNIDERMSRNEMKREIPKETEINDKSRRLEQFVAGMKHTLDGRILRMEKKNLPGVFFFGMTHLKYVSFISVLGDVFTLFTAK